MVLKPPDKVLLQQGIEHHPWRFLDFSQNPIELLLGAHQRIDVFHRKHLGVLGGCCPRNSGQRLARRIGDKMKVEVAAGAMGHCARPG